MKIFKLAAAAALAVSGLTISVAPAAAAQRGDNMEHRDGDRHDGMRGDMRHDNGRHNGWNHNRGRHNGWGNHRVCRTVWRHHHRERVCYRR